MLFYKISVCIGNRCLFEFDQVVFDLRNMKGFDGELGGFVTWRMCDWWGWHWRAGSVGA